MAFAEAITSLVTYLIAHSGLQDTSLTTADVNWTAINPDAWWGPAEEQATQDTGIYEAKITFDDEMIEDLRTRLNNHRSMVKPLEGTAFEYGFNHNEVANWTRYWAEEYDFKAREKDFNKYPAYKTNIQGLDIFFIRVTPDTDKEIVPLLLLHGWPGSIKEFWDAIPLLTAVDDDKDFAVEVIVPCLPGFGWSETAVRPGLGSPRIAVVFRNLMKRLGFDKWYIQGGDVGSLTNSYMSTLYPDEILGFHTNMPVVASAPAAALEVLGAFNPSLIGVDPDLAYRMYPLTKILANALEEFGFMHIQATKPDTIGALLDDSPTGLLAYILEKFSIKTDVDGGLWENYDPNWLIDNLMVYWSTKSATTSARFYAETMNKELLTLGLDKIPTPVLTWVAQAPLEVVYQPPSILKLKYPNLINVTLFEVGGHFLAQGQPKEFSADVLKALQAFRDYHKNGGKIDTGSPNLLEKLKAELAEANSNILDAVKSSAEKVADTGAKIVDGAKNSAQKAADTATGAVKNVAETATNAVENAKNGAKSLFSKITG